MPPKIHPQSNSVATALQTVTRLATGLLTVASATASWAGTTTEWKGGAAAWENAAMWGGTLPSRSLLQSKREAMENRDDAWTSETEGDAAWAVSLDSGAAFLRAKDERLAAVCVVGK